MSDMYNLIEKARCPRCNEKVILPRKALRDVCGGDNSPEDPLVWCSDMGHWAGYLSDCIKLVEVK